MDEYGDGYEFTAAQENEIDRFVLDAFLRWDHFEYNEDRKHYHDGGGTLGVNNTYGDSLPTLLDMTEGELLAEVGKESKE